MNDTRAGNGVGFIGLLALLFVGLKLMRFIDWPWLWVLSPIWITLLVAIAMISFAVVMVKR